MLCESGATMDGKDDDGKTPRMLAVERNFLRCAATISERMHFGTSGYEMQAHPKGSADVRFMCRWGCGEGIPESQLTDHEKECPKRVRCYCCRCSRRSE